MQACQIGFNPDYQEQAPSIEEIHQMSGIAILEFGASWCPHCIAAQAPLRAVLESHQLPYIKVADGKGKPLGRAFKVKLWPTIILLSEGQEIARIVRPIDESEVQALLKAT